ncbi:bifunctional arginine dihydrolase/ornithine cyclodeaminase [Verrucomicrobiota bacterium sgz303538]
MNTRPSLLMCPPEFYDVEYVINPWMEGNIHRASHEGAHDQWRALVTALEPHATIEQVSPQRGLPDMVFTANAGLVIGKKVVLSRFFHPERRGEEKHFKAWFEQHGFEVYELPRDLTFEGGGDALLDPERGLLWAGYGQRTELDAHPLLADFFGIEVLSLRLIAKRFYHLDTCFCPLTRGYVLYYPEAFDASSNLLIESRVPPEKRIAIDESDAVNFACNAVAISDTIVLNKAGKELQRRLTDAGFRVIETPLREFIKSGGAAKCLTLSLVQGMARGPEHAGARVESQVIRMEGHLLDSGLLGRALDLAVEGGGSFQILEFNLGKQRQSISKAEIKISAPSSDVLEKIISQLIDLGAVPTVSDENDAELLPVTKAGVAPDDFYSTSIYPTEVRVHGQWLQIEGQRMDGVVVVDPGRARCKLLRDLEPGEQVVVGVRGIRTSRKAEARDERGRPGAGCEEFGFMGAGVSSERRVELVVEQIAWELRRIRERGGKVVVVPGPVVIHTGAGEHLAQLIREGYVQALLGGNAIAVHDLEQALLGTSLGVDLKRGVPVRGGHRHHLRTINIIRNCGSIAAAVEQGVITSGVFYECIKAGVPFALAGSIRDDGPLPDTEMDLVRAQAEYARLVRGADMVLMLSTMLHSIGVGNMTPAGVKLVCVDINPAVVTKLADRGSLESTGIVTDVGLFLSLLVQRLGRMEAGQVVA